jgi:hypothetical protein
VVRLTEAARRALPGEATARFAHRRVRTTAKGAGQRPIRVSAVPPELGCVAPWSRIGHELTARQAILSGAAREAQRRA